jgi:hypothetical protein
MRRMAGDFMKTWQREYFSRVQVLKEKRKMLGSAVYNSANRIEVLIQDIKDETDEAAKIKMLDEILDAAIDIRVWLEEL